jgi:prepilin-type N-terminal cleavage/methylation domain-containing protein
MSKKNNKGFTLIELLVVIAIIAVLSIVVILTLNPAELLRQARDSNRISDMATVKSAISLFLADQATSSAALGANNTCYVDIAGIANGTTSCTWFSGIVIPTVSSSAPKKVDGSGWMPINFNAISSGAPIGQLPTDPLDNDKFHLYTYHPSTTLVFKLETKMESVKYSTSGSNDVEGTDGGSDPFKYESGTNLSL